MTNVGQLSQADMEFGDLTVLIGPEASGKTVFLELLKLAIGTGSSSRGAVGRDRNGGLIQL